VIDGEGKGVVASDSGVLGDSSLEEVYSTRRSPSRTEIFKSYKLSHKLTY